MIIEIIRTKVLVKAGGEEEARAYFLKMIGDYYRYMAETAVGDRLETVKGEAVKAYDEA